MASLTKRGGKWWLRWKERRPGGGWTCRSETYPTKREGDERRLAVEAEKRASGRVRSRQVRAEAGLDAVVAAYLEHSARNNAPRTTLRKGQMLGLFLRYMREGSPRRQLYADELSYDVLSAFWVWLGRPETGRHVHRRSPETCRKVVAEVEVMWKWAFQRQQRAAWEGVPYPDSLELRREPLPDRLAPTWTQMDACIDHAGDWQARLYFLLRCTGLRVAQAMHVTWDDVDLDARTLRIRPGLPGSKTRAEKSGRTVPMAPVLVDELATWGRREGWLITSRRQEGQREARARDAARAWRRAGVPGDVCELPHHAFRAGFVSELKRAGADNEAVEHLIGHARGIRARYADPRALPLVEAVALVPPFGESSVEDLDERRRQGAGHGDRP